MVPTHFAKPPLVEGGEPVLPDDDICYVIGRDGFYKRIRNPLYSALVKVTAIAHLPVLKESATVNVAKVPEKLFRRVESFFVEVYKEHKSEAAVILFYNPTTSTWGAQAPLQEVSGGKVDYKLEGMRPPLGFTSDMVFGSIHSHASMSAFFSGTDDKDDKSADGLHIVVGKLDSKSREYAARWMLAGLPFKAEFENVVEGVDLPKADPIWLAQVSKPTPVITKWSSHSDYLMDDYRGSHRGSGKDADFGPSGVVTSGHFNNSDAFTSKMLDNKLASSGLSVGDTVPKKETPLLGAAKMPASIGHSGCSQQVAGSFVWDPKELNYKQLPKSPGVDRGNTSSPASQQLPGGGAAASAKAEIDDPNVAISEMHSVIDEIKQSYNLGELTWEEATALMKETSESFIGDHEVGIDCDELLLDENIDMCHL